MAPARELCAGPAFGDEALRQLFASGNSVNGRSRRNFVADVSAGAAWTCSTAVGPACANPR